MCVRVRSIGSGHVLMLPAGHLICRWLVSAVVRCSNPHSVRSSDLLPLHVLEAASTVWGTHGPRIRVMKTLPRVLRVRS